MHSNEKPGFTLNSPDKCGLPFELPLVGVGKLSLAGDGRGVWRMLGIM